MNGKDVYGKFRKKILKYSVKPINTFQGFISPILLVIAVIILGSIFVAYQNNLLKINPQIINKLESLKPTLTPTQIPTPTLTPIPTSTPIPTPTPTNKPQVTPTEAPKIVSGPPGAGFSSLTVGTEKGNFSVSVLMIDLNSAKVVTDTANENDCGNDCPTLSLKEYVERNNGFAGVNGSYFCPDTYPDCSGKKNAFDFPVYNSRLNKWINGGNLFWNSRSMFYFDGSGAHYKQNANDFSGGLMAGLVNYPGILSDGNVQIDDNQSGLSDKQKAKGTKVGIGVSSEKNVMVVIAQNVNMQEFGYVFKALGAKGALNLDTGGSTALYYNGRYIFGPGRNIPNAIIFTR